MHRHVPILVNNKLKGCHKTPKLTIQQLYSNYTTMLLTYVQKGLLDSNFNYGKQLLTFRFKLN